MPYATLNDLLKRTSEGRLIELTDRGPAPSGVIDSVVVDQTLNDATATIDGYLRGRYSLPLDPVPSQAMLWCANIALWLLCSYGLDIPEPVKANYDMTIRELRDAAAGTLRLDVPEQNSASSGKVQFAADDRRFTSNSLKDL